MDKLVDKISIKHEYDIVVTGLKVKFKKKKYMTAWSTYVFENKKQVVVFLMSFSKSGVPKYG